MVILIGQCRFLYVTIINVIVAFVSLAADAIFPLLKFCEKPMKKIITLSCLLFLVACATGQELIKENKIRIGMSKADVEFVMAFQANVASEIFLPLSFFQFYLHFQKQPEIVPVKISMYIFPVPPQYLSTLACQ